MTGATKLSKLSETIALVRATAILKSLNWRVVMETWRQSESNPDSFILFRLRQTERAWKQEYNAHVIYGAIVMNKIFV